MLLNDSRRLTITGERALPNEMRPAVAVDRDRRPVLLSPTADRTRQWVRMTKRIDTALTTMRRGVGRARSDKKAEKDYRSALPRLPPRASAFNVFSILVFSALIVRYDWTHTGVPPPMTGPQHLVDNSCLVAGRRPRNGSHRGCSWTWISGLRLRFGA
jgi:hypothetical protein